jgi:hypothetical protein
MHSVLRGRRGTFDAGQRKRGSRRRGDYQMEFCCFFARCPGRRVVGPAQSVRPLRRPPRTSGQRRKTVAGTSDTDIRQKAPIALDANKFSARIRLIRTLTSRHLRHATRTALHLNLTNGPEPFSEVRELVRKEQGYRAFLTFDFRHDVSGALLTITAPEAAAEDAAIYSHTSHHHRSPWRSPA